MRQQLPVLKDYRVHEVCGPAALPFALIMAGRASGPIMFIDKVQAPERLHAHGVGAFVNVSRLLLSFGEKQKDVLWIAEEALSAGCVPTVIVRLYENIDLTAGRRLQLAAEAGKSLGLFILPDGMGSNAAETRWRCSQIFQPNEQSDSTLFEWNCIKNKSGTNENWTIDWNEKAHHINLFSPTADRSLLEANAR